jgi:hypothetical protein
MMAATVIGVFFVPLLYVAVRRLFPGRSRPNAGTLAHEP